MKQAFGVAFLLLNIIEEAWSARASPIHLTARHLLGSSFGIPRNASYDYVVIGGGTAGLTVAARLAEMSSVAVVEAGSFYEIDNGNLSQIPAYSIWFSGKDPKDTSPLIDWGFVTTPQAVSNHLQK
jgi:choline dehydrogenase